MSKYLLILVSSFCLLLFTTECFAASDPGDDLPLIVGDNPTSSGNPHPRSPVLVPSATLDGYTFYINSSHPDYVLQLVDANDVETVLFETFVPESVNSVVLPSTFEGEYRIQLIWGYWCFWGYVTL
jgi:hypothetical protein